MHTRADSARPVVGDWLLLLLLAASLAGNVYLGSELARRPATANESKRTAGPEIGAVIHTLDGEASDGTRRAIRIAGATLRTVLFVYSPTCPWCQRSWPLFERLSSRSTGRFNFAALCMGGSSGMFSTDMPSIGNPTRETVAALRAGSVPQTIVFSPEGRVERIWVGGWVGDVADQLSTYFGIPVGEVSLPKSQ